MTRGLVGKTAYSDQLLLKKTTLYIVIDKKNNLETEMKIISSNRKNLLINQLI